MLLISGHWVPIPSTVTPKALAFEPGLGARPYNSQRMLDGTDPQPDFLDHKIFKPGLVLQNSGGVYGSSSETPEDAN